MLSTHPTLVLGQLFVFFWNRSSKRLFDSAVHMEHKFACYSHPFILCFIIIFCFYSFILEMLSPFFFLYRYPIVALFFQFPIFYLTYVYHKKPHFYFILTPQLLTIQLNFRLRIPFQVPNFSKLYSV